MNFLSKVITVFLCLAMVVSSNCSALWCDHENGMEARQFYRNAGIPSDILDDDISIILLFIYKIDPHTVEDGYSWLINAYLQKRGSNELDLYSDFLNSAVINFDDYTNSFVYIYLNRKFNTFSGKICVYLNKYIFQPMGLKMDRNTIRSTKLSVNWFMRNWNLVFPILERMVVIDGRVILTNGVDPAEHPEHPVHPLLPPISTFLEREHTFKSN